MKWVQDMLKRKVLHKKTLVKIILRKKNVAFFSKPETIQPYRSWRFWEQIAKIDLSTIIFIYFLLVVNLGGSFFPKILFHIFFVDDLAAHPKKPLATRALFHRAQAKRRSHSKRKKTSKVSMESDQSFKGSRRQTCLDPENLTSSDFSHVQISMILESISFYQDVLVAIIYGDLCLTNVFWMGWSHHR